MACTDVNALAKLLQEIIDNESTKALNDRGESWRARYQWLKESVINLHEVNVKEYNKAVKEQLTLPFIIEGSLYATTKLKETIGEIEEYIYED